MNQPHFLSNLEDVKIKVVNDRLYLTGVKFYEPNNKPFGSLSKFWRDIGSVEDKNDLYSSKIFDRI